MPVKFPPLQIRFMDRLGNIDAGWLRWFHDLVTVPQANQRTISAAYTVLPSDTIIFVSAGTFTLTIPVAPQLAGKVFFVFNYGAGTVTLAASSGSVKGVTSLGTNVGVTVLQDGLNAMSFN